MPRIGNRYFLCFCPVYAILCPHRIFNLQADRLTRFRFRNRIEFNLHGLNFLRERRCRTFDEYLIAYAQVFLKLDYRNTYFALIMRDPANELLALFHV